MRAPRAKRAREKPQLLALPAKRFRDSRVERCSRRRLPTLFARFQPAPVEAAPRLVPEDGRGAPSSRKPSLGYSDRPVKINTRRGARPPKAPVRCSPFHRFNLKARVDLGARIFFVPADSCVFASPSPGQGIAAGPRARSFARVLSLRLSRASRRRRVFARVTATSSGVPKIIARDSSRGGRGGYL